MNSDRVMEDDQIFLFTSLGQLQRETSSQTTDNWPILSGDVPTLFMLANRAENFRPRIVPNCAELKWKRF